MPLKQYSHMFCFFNLKRKGNYFLSDLDTLICHRLRLVTFSTVALWSIIQDRGHYDNTHYWIITFSRLVVCRLLHISKNHDHCRVKCSSFWKHLAHLVLESSNLTSELLGCMPALKCRLWASSRASWESRLAAISSVEVHRLFSHTLWKCCAASFGQVW